MGCGAKAVDNDIDDWFYFKREVGLRVNWDVYSSNARHAKALYNTYGLTGDKLEASVGCLATIDSLVKEHREEEKERAEYLRLKEKFEK